MFHTILGARKFCFAEIDGIIELIKNEIVVSGNQLAIGVDGPRLRQQDLHIDVHVVSPR